MLRLAHVLNIVIRVLAATALSLGVAFWLGYARSFTLLHMAIGTGLVLCLWVLAGILWRRGGRLGLATFATAWGLGTWLFGFTHGRLMPGSLHWIVALTHLATGVVAVVIAGQLVSALTDSRVLSGSSTSSPELGS
jgi:hypothetical protein